MAKSIVKKIFIFLLSLSTLFVFLTPISARTVSDFNQGGYGPILNGIQLGMSTSLMDFYLAADKNFYHVYKNYSMFLNAYAKDGKRIGSLEIRFSQEGGEKTYQINPDELENPRSFFLGSPGVFTEILSHKGNFSALVDKIELIIAKCPGVKIYLEGPGSIGQFKEWSVTKVVNRDSTLRYTDFRILRTALDGQYMTDEEFLQTLSNEYKLGKLGKSAASSWEKTPEERQKNGWRVFINLNLNDAITTMFVGQEAVWMMEDELGKDVVVQQSPKVKTAQTNISELTETNKIGDILGKYDFKGDYMSGGLDINQTGNGYEAVIELVTNEEPYSTASLEGTVTLQGKKLVIRDGEAQIVITFADELATIEQNEEAAGYCGMGATFAGKYEVKSSSKSETKQEKTSVSFLELCSRGTRQEVENAIKAGADIHATDANGLTSLMYAIANNDSSVFELLLEQGANANAVDKDGKTFFMHVVIANNLNLFYQLLNIEMLDLNLNAEDKDGKKAIDYAQTGSDIYRTLKEMGAAHVDITQLGENNTIEDIFGNYDLIGGQMSGSLQISLGEKWPLALLELRTNEESPKTILFEGRVRLRKKRLIISDGDSQIAITLDGETATIEANEEASEDVGLNVNGTYQIAESIFDF
ncbi:MAG: ankyrin repeat domain-containing protein [Rickettsiales bacterium]|jgi:hypothetical protein|nr:ankyrin repeat domain-containing protein [Rickettsiales bacterium]